ncbi:hypothetical protein EG68_02473 [Paragonimus skrjabini miyazakii]|uniref:Uncharacterized protein n=1 Tax=Paragonimus skrjabini miyazakii TaxID=59628 RepID=A0A8S9YB68_9TREM|nr:hypothetical protein EG68_02473 [Paragonimus skrjabini miyazakii]
MMRDSESCKKAVLLMTPYFHLQLGCLFARCRHLRASLWVCCLRNVARDVVRHLVVVAIVGVLSEIPNLKYRVSE